MNTRHRRRGVVAAGIAGVLVAAVAAAAGLPFLTGERSLSAVDSRTSSAVAAETTALTKAAAGAAEAAVPATPAPAPAPAPAPVKTAKQKSLDAYAGLGMWVDIWDGKAWSDPDGAVRDMAKNGVRTLYLETANSNTKYAIKDPAKTATFIRTAHANGMKVVAWYLPHFENEQLDYDRSAAAIRFRTTDGQGFDSFALDIESPKVKSIAERNARLERLTNRIRALAGPDYALGACIPSPVGLAKGGGWKPFPYGMLAKNYDVFVPMSYYTWHGEGNKAALEDTLANVRILRAQPGAEKTPIHLIGGLMADSSPSETKAFIRGGQQSGVIGMSFYTWDDMTPAQWEQMKLVR